MQDIIDPDWFVDASMETFPDPIGDFAREMKRRRENPFEARWVVTTEGKKWLLVNVETHDPALLGFLCYSRIEEFEEAEENMEEEDAPLHD